MSKNVKKPKFKLGDIVYINNQIPYKAAALYSDEEDNLRKCQKRKVTFQIKSVYTMDGSISYLLKVVDKRNNKIAKYFEDQDFEFFQNELSFWLPKTLKDKKDVKDVINLMHL